MGAEPRHYSPNTSASKRNTRAPSRHASSGRPALRARLPQKLILRPAPLGGDLRQQQAAAMTVLDDETMSSDDNGLAGGRIDFLERPEDRNLERQLRNLISRYRRKSRVFGRRLPRATRHFRAPGRRQHWSVPMQPRSSPRRLMVTKTPDASGNSHAMSRRRPAGQTARSPTPAQYATTTPSGRQSVAIVACRTGRMPRRGIRRHHRNRRTLRRNART